MVDFLFIIIELFFGSDVINENLSTSAFFEGVGHFERKFQTDDGTAHQPLLMAAN